MLSSYSDLVEPPTTISEIMVKKRPKQIYAVVLGSLLVNGLHLVSGSEAMADH